MAEAKGFKDRLTGTTYDLKDATAREGVATNAEAISGLDGKFEAALAPTFSTSTAYTAGQYVWYDGKLYRFTADHAAGSWNAAEAVVWDGINDLQDSIDNVNCSDIFLHGYYVTNQNAIGAFTPTNQYRSCVIPVGVGDILKLTGIAGSSARLWAFADYHKTITRKADVNAYLDDGELTVETGEAYFVFNAEANSNLHIPALAVLNKSAYLTNLKSDTIRLDYEMSRYTCDELFRNGYYNTAGTRIGKFISDNSFRSCIMHVEVGEILNVSGIGATNGRLWAFASADGEITRRADAGAFLDNGVLTVESGEVLFIFNASATSNTHPLSLSIQVDREKNLETLRSSIADIDDRIGNIENVQLIAKSVRNNLISDGVGNLLGVKCYNNGIEAASNYGLDGTKYEIDIGAFDKCHVFFKYRHNTYAEYDGTDVLVPIASVGKNNALNVQELYRGVNVQTGRLYKTQYIYPSNISAANTELLNPLFYKPKQGESALRVFYTGTVTSASSVLAVFDSGALTFKVDGTIISSVTLNDTDTIQNLADAINSISDFTCAVVNSNGTVGDLMLPTSLTIEMVNSANRDGATVYGTLFIDIPFKVDTSWHTCEFVVDKTNQFAFVAFDGLTKRIPFASSRALTDSVIVIGGSYTSDSNLTVRDLELDINSYGDAEILSGKINNASEGDTYQLISRHNPRLMIFMGHGLFVGSESEAQAAYIASGSISTSQEGMQASTDRLNIVFSTLASRGYVPVTLEQIKLWKKGSLELPKRCFACIFDDNRLINYLDYDMRKPFIDYGVKPGIAQISDLRSLTDIINANNTTYVAKDVIDMINLAGWYICSHTSNHRHLAEYTVSENIEKLKEDVLSCNTHNLHSDILVYPYGDINAGSLNAMQTSDFALGISIVENRYNCRMLSDYRLERTDIGTSKSLESVLSPFI